MDSLHNSDSLISILVPAKNVARYINACVDSIVAQSYSNWELIVVDDNSTDSTFKYLQNYQKRDSRIKVFKNRGNGIIDALTMAYDKSTGDYITRMDADDLMAEDKIAHLLSALLEKGKGFVSTGLVKYFSDESLGEGYKKYETWLNDLTRLSNNYNDVYKECVIPSPCWMTHRKDLDMSGAFSGLYPEDYDLCFRFRKFGLKVIGVPTVLHFWRDYQNRTSRTDSHYADNSFLYLKVYHFLSQDYDSNKTLILWGAGKKGKTIALNLIDKNVDFNWICDNPNKIGHDIYGKTMTAVPLDWTPNIQIIISVAQQGAQAKIKQVLSDSGINDTSVFWFC